MPHPLLEHIFYINLESRTDRNEHVIKELNKLSQHHPHNLNLHYERVNAIKHPIGELGCALSHIQCLEMAKERQYPYVFICEDDITFLQPELLLENLQKFWNTPPPQGWDVLIIAGNNFTPFEVVSEYAIQVRFCVTTTGYIVTQPYYDTLLQNFKRAAERLQTVNPEIRNRYAIDVQWQKLQKSKKGRWFMLIPPTVVQAESYSDIENRAVNYSDWMLRYDKGRWEPTEPESETEQEAET